MAKKYRMTGKQWASKSDRYIGKISDPRYFPKFVAKGGMKAWMRFNPKASKSQKLSKWRSLYLEELFDIGRK